MSASSNACRSGWIGIALGWVGTPKASVRGSSPPVRMIASHRAASSVARRETGSVNPLTLQDNDGNPLIAMFSATDVIPEEYAEHAPHAVDAPGVAVVQSLSGSGIIIDPGQEHGFQISAEGVERIREDFLKPAAEAMEDTPDTPQ